MDHTHILVDFENVQPPAEDIALVRGDGVRLAIFRGPGQMKYSADVAEAWQPLGANLKFIRCAKAGRNAVDMHIAFYLGELVAAHLGAGAGPGEGARFVIVSRDTDFDPLLMHIRSQGFEALRVASIKAALGGAAEKVEPRAAKTRSRRGKVKAEAAQAPAPAPAEKASKRAAKKTPAAKKAVAKRSPVAKKAASLIPVPAPQPPKRSPRAGNGSTPAAPDARTKVIESLQRMGEKRPNKRKGLERHIESHLGRNLAPGEVETLMHQLERDGVLAFNDNKVEYRLPKSRK